MGGENNMAGTVARNGRRNGFAIRSLGDIVAMATLLAMLLATVGWGLKLEGELNSIRDNYNARLIALEARVADGILPRSEERIRQHAVEIGDLRKRLERLEDRHTNGRHPNSTN